ncbi:hypothetical protein [Pseudomonas sp. NPDC007930]
MRSSETTEKTAVQAAKAERLNAALAAYKTALAEGRVVKATAKPA